MNSSSIGKLLLIIAIIVIVNVVVLSPGLLGVEIGGDSALGTAFGATLLVVSCIVLLYSSYSLLFRPPLVITVREIKSQEDYRPALEQYRNVKVLKSDIMLAEEQLDRIEKKSKALLEVLGQRFETTELSYMKFRAVIHEVEQLFYQNIKGMLVKLNVFDASEFTLFASQQNKSKFSSRLIEEKMSLFNEYLADIAGYLGANEEILLKLDKLMLEISQLGTADYNDIEDMPGMKEIDDLIKHTKYYKQ
ncbi:hypothetical protein [Paenibacillus sp. GCM10027626]|uniref:hypothetical protein n=1 Tax=Paenibacillus sp. GCM10027626 TaxID=3273411 RepID=UPI0036282FC5